LLRIRPHKSPLFPYTTLFRSKQLNKVIDVVKVNDLTYDSFVERELALIKVTATRSSRSEIMQIAQVFRAKVIDISPDKLTIEVRSEEHTSELQSRFDLVCRLL